MNLNTPSFLADLQLMQLEIQVKDLLSEEKDENFSSRMRAVQFYLTQVEQRVKSIMNKDFLKDVSSQEFKENLEQEKKDMQVFMMI